MPDWSIDKWHTGRKMTLLQAFGISDQKFHYPRLFPVLTTQASHHQQPLQVNSGGSSGPVNESTGGIPRVQKGPLEQYARKLLRDKGWPGQWDSFNKLVMHESGWNPRIANPSSGAFGIAQALGHGNSQTQGTLANEYGPIGNDWLGMTPKEMKQANSGNGYWQLVWMAGYIKAVYGSPNAAWAQYYNHPGGQGSY